MRKLLIIGAVVLAAAAAQAKTVALWPMTKDEARNAANMRCAISSANGFSTVPSAMTFEETTIGWNLPPNPDPTANKLFSVTSYWDFVSDPTANNGTSVKNLFKVDSLEVFETLSMRHDFTIEGFIKPWAVQDGSWHVILETNGGANKEGKGFFTWQIRNNKQDAEGNPILGFYVYGAQLGFGDTLLGPAFTAEEAIDLTNRWHHIALTFEADTGNGKGRFSFYYDGNLRGSAEGNNPRNDYTPTATYQTFGGRYGGPLTLARWKYWRLSDTVLTPAEFLNYGGTGTVVPKPEVPELETTETVAYWKFGANEDGMIDAHDYVGDFDLSRGLIDYVKGSASIEMMGCRSTLAASADRPFVQPPNTTVTIPGGLRGSFRGGNSPAADMIVEGAGSGLDLDQDFTVEAYVRFLMTEGWKSRHSGNDGYIFGTVKSAGNQRWVLVWHFVQKTLYLGSWNFDLKKGFYLDPFCSPPTDTAWHHLALVFDATARTWTLHIDGTAVKTLAHPAEDTVQSAGYFGILGRGGTVNSPCEIAALRISKAKLAPEQFLCESANLMAATNVTAFWPLDTPNGVTLDGRDIVGSYSFTHGAYDGDDYKLTAVTNDQPVITNPERKLGVYSHPGAQPKGAVRFCNGDKGQKSFLYYSRDQLCQYLRGATTEWTLEFYTKRLGAPLCDEPGDLIFFLAPSDGDYVPAPNSGQLTVAYRKDGFAVFDKASAAFRRAVNGMEYNHYTVICPGTTNAIPLNEWAHVAITRKIADNVLTYAFYVNGEKKGEMSGTMDSTSTGAIAFFGGCYDLWGSKCGWNGLWSSMRLTKGVLDPKDFLCATPETPIPTYAEETLAYWPFDYKNSVLDLASYSSYGYTPFNTDYTKVTGSTEEAVYRISNPAASLPLPEMRNRGSSAVVEGGVLTYPGLAEKLSYNRPFTVEGWIRWERQATTKEEILFGANGNTSVAHGWRVYVDNSGTTPALKLYGNAPSGDYTAVVGDTLMADISSWDGVWKHLALVYDPADGNCGTWKLYVDNELAKTLDNAWYPGLTPWLQGDFTMSGATTKTSTGFTGLVDEWRVVTKALAQGELLKEADRKGLLIIFR